VKLANYGLRLGDLTGLKGVFEHATTFGSLIQVPEGLAAKLTALKQLSEVTSEDLFVSNALKQLGTLVQQAELLSGVYDTVAANPPYMGGKAMNPLLKKFAKDNFPKSKSDLFAASTERFLDYAKPTGFIGLMTPFTWMFLKSYQALRGVLLDDKTLHSLIQPEYHAFFESAYVPICTFVIQNCHATDYRASFIKLTDFYGAELQPQKTLEAITNPSCGWLYRAKPDEFRKIPTSPVAYWVSDRVREIFDSHPPLKTVAPTKQGLATGDNGRFLREWPEVSLDRSCLHTSRFGSSDDQPRWFPCNKGGAFRKWYGNNRFLVNWEADGVEIKSFVDTSGKLRSRPQNQSFYFREGLTWSAISSSSLSMRYSPADHMFETKGAMCFPDSSATMFTVLGFANSKLVNLFLSATSPTLDFHEGPVGNLPYLSVSVSGAGAKSAAGIAKSDWDAYERSWNFQTYPIPRDHSETLPNLEFRYFAWIAQNRETIDEMKRLEEENNRLFIDAYGLANELTPEVPIEQITLTVNPAYRYGGKLIEEEQWTRFRQDTMQELVSYAIGCMMGRYSLDEPGLIYAHSGNAGFDPSRYTTFPADDDGIVPLTDTGWFDDDASRRLVEFISVAWDAAYLEDNLTFLADNLSPKKNELSRGTLRRYLCDSFFRSHLQTYKKRPIYWLFSSGKHKAIQCLVYLHRYNEGTLARMRSEYVIPLQGKMAARIETLQGDVQVATSTAHRKRLEKELTKLKKQRVELIDFDEKLRHYADRRIALDLDDGVKVNYGKFGDLLAEVKNVTGKKPVVT
jgi:type II restriction/modification system DNA methylase subunit YeeA